MYIASGIRGFRQTTGENGALLSSNKVNTARNFTISFRRRASAASRLAGLLASRLSALFLPRLRSSWIMVFFTYILSISLQEPPLEFSKPLRLFGSGGRPSIQAIPPNEPFVDLPFIVLRVTKRINCSISIGIGKLTVESSNPRDGQNAQSSPTPNNTSNSRGFLCPGRPTTPRQVVGNQKLEFPAWWSK